MKYQKCLKLSVLALGLTFASLGFSASSDIYKDKDNECASWLCLPGGWVSPGCQKARKAWIKRVTAVKCNRKGCRRLYTDLPRFNLCVVTDANEGKVFSALNNPSSNALGSKYESSGVDPESGQSAAQIYASKDHEGSDMSYQVDYRVVIPEHNYPCTKWKRSTHCSGNHCDTNKTCIAVRRVPEYQYITTSDEYVNYEHIEVGWEGYEERPAHIYTRTAVKADGGLYGKRWEELIYPLELVNENPEVIEGPTLAENSDYQDQEGSQTGTNYHEAKEQIESVDEKLNITQEMSTEEIQAEIDRVLGH